MRDEVKRLLVGMAVGFLLGILQPWQACRPRPDPTPGERVVTVPDRDIERERPDTVWQVRERIRYVPAERDRTRESAGTPDTAFIRRFCAPVPVAPVDSAPRDSVRPERPTYAEAPLLPRFAGKYANGRLTLTATRSDGSLYEQVDRARAPFQFATRDTTIFVQQGRQWPRLLRLALPTLVCAGAATAVALAVEEAPFKASAAFGTGCLAGALAF